MGKFYKFIRYDEEIADAMAVFNELHKKDAARNKFTVVDAFILSLVHSYHYTNSRCFASNKYIASKVLTTEPTVQKSINKLSDMNFIDRKAAYNNGTKHRVLIYNEEAVEKFKFDMQNVLFEYDEKTDL